jgi:gallate decarboxylase subunit C
LFRCGSHNKTVIPALFSGVYIFSQTRLASNPRRIELAHNDHSGDTEPRVHDLRSALQVLGDLPGELVQTSVEVDPHAELSGVYRYVGAGGTCSRPTRRGGPAMIFNKVKGFPDFRVAIGLLGSRKRVGKLLNCEPKKLGFLLKDAVLNPIPPVTVGKE